MVCIHEKVGKIAKIYIFNVLYSINSTLELHNISKSNILPFHDESFVQLRKIGENSNMKALFNKAITEAMVKETEDNDGLPSKDFAFQMVIDSSPGSQKKKNGRKSMSKKYYSRLSKVGRI